MCSLPIVTMQQIIIFFQFSCDCAILSIVNADSRHTPHTDAHPCIFIPNQFYSLYAIIHDVFFSNVHFYTHIFASVRPLSVDIMNEMYV